MDQLKILFVAAEAAPLAKIGGLGDVAGTLPGKLLELPDELDIRLALPFYPHLKDSGLILKPISSFTIAMKTVLSWSKYFYLTSTVYHCTS